MKKIIYSLLALAITLQSCKKDSNQISPENESFYPIGTVIEMGKNVVLLNNNSNSSVTATGKISYFTGYGNEAATKPFASGYYYGNTVIATSLNNAYNLTYQGDKNLVLRNASQTALWWTGVQSAGANSRMNFQTDGNFVHEYDSNGYVTWSASVWAGPNPIWILQDDGNFVGYSNHTKNYSQFDPNYIISITITGSPFGSTGTAGGKKSSRIGKIR